MEEKENWSLYTEQHTVKTLFEEREKFRAVIDKYLREFSIKHNDIDYVQTLDLALKEFADLKLENEVLFDDVSILEKEREELREFIWEHVCEKCNEVCEGDEIQDWYGDWRREEPCKFLKFLTKDEIDIIQESKSG